MASKARHLLRRCGILTVRRGPNLLARSTFAFMRLFAAAVIGIVRGWPHYAIAQMCI